MIDENGRDTRTAVPIWTEAPSAIDGLVASEPFDFTGFLTVVPKAKPAPAGPEAWVDVVVRTENQEMQIRQRKLGCAG